MKVKQEIDLTAIITLFGFVVAMVAWGIRLESKVNQNVANFTIYEQMQEKQQALQWDAMEQRLDRLGEEIALLEKRVRDKP